MGSVPYVQIKLSCVHIEPSCGTDPGHGDGAPPPEPLVVVVVEPEEPVDVEPLEVAPPVPVAEGPVPDAELVEPPEPAALEASELTVPPHAVKSATVVNKMPE